MIDFETVKDDELLGYMREQIDRAVVSNPTAYLSYDDLEWSIGRTRYGQINEARALQIFRQAYNEITLNGALHGNARRLRDAERGKKPWNPFEVDDEALREFINPDDPYQPLDLDEWFSEEHPDPVRFGRGEIFYEGSFHIVAGEPASGKSLLCYAVAIDLMRQGKNVLLLDEEAGPRDALGKMLALGATQELLRQHLIYLDPKNRDIARTAKGFTDLVTSRDVALVVVDSFGAVLGSAGKDENSNSDVGSLIKPVLMPLAKEHGVAVVAIDHKTKGDTGRYARGAGNKLGFVDVQINVVASKPFSKDQSGELTLECAKNRFGDYAEGDRWRVDVMTGNGKIGLEPEFMTPEQAAAREDEDFASAELSKAIATHYRTIYPKKLGARNLFDIEAIKKHGSKQKIDTHAKWLVARGVLSREASNGPLLWVPDQTALELPEAVS